ncbi:MAG: succinylglutamate desuccinylase/aspartoacylase family protein [Ruminococcus sp.]|nr:succinylglutamate desuccinylase/aspartoacylase family protein [Ruminococcus sp.]
MKKTVLYEMKNLYRDNMRVTGYEFGCGEKSVCVVGSTRGNEIQQLYTCGLLVKTLKRIEKAGLINENKSIIVIPSINSSSMNIEKRFWPTDNTDINRMFPGYNLGETTQRIAGGVFEKINDYEYGIQFASFFMPGKFLPHVRMMMTENTDIEDAKKFGLQYIVKRTPRPFDTTTLNYNWQMWGTKAFSIYTHETENLDESSAMTGVYAVLNFLSQSGIINYSTHRGYNSSIIDADELYDLQTPVAGIFHPLCSVGDSVSKGQLLSKIIDPYEGKVLAEIKAPEYGNVFFMNNKQLVYANQILFKLTDDYTIIRKAENSEQQ